jgi:hypothetical protein
VCPRATYTVLAQCRCTLLGMSASPSLREDIVKAFLHITSVCKIRKASGSNQLGASPKVGQCSSITKSPPLAAAAVSSNLRPFISSLVTPPPRDVTDLSMFVLNVQLSRTEPALVLRHKNRRNRAAVWSCLSCVHVFTLLCCTL